MPKERFFLQQQINISAHMQLVVWTTRRTAVYYILLHVSPLLLPKIIPSTARVAQIMPVAIQGIVYSIADKVCTEQLNNNNNNNNGSFEFLRGDTSTFVMIYFQGNGRWRHSVSKSSV